MNRDILFRGMPIGSGEWTEGSLLINEFGQPFIGTLIEPKRSEDAIAARQSGKSFHRFLGIGFVAVVSSTIGQYTGLIDKNGKRIFEGDVLVTSNDDPQFDIWNKEDFGETTVIWGSDHPGFLFSGWSPSQDEDSVYDMRFVEVIRSIHE